jgi:protocatechuate 3,4-dioxygenase beta subunit
MPFRLLLLMLFPSVVAAQNASLQGVVTSDGQPMAGVHVQLVGVANGGVGDVYGAMSDRTGRFSMASVPPGAYFVSATRSGFVEIRDPRNKTPLGSVNLKPGRSITDFKIEMTPYAVLSGRVVDQYGDPIPYIPIRVYPIVEHGVTFAGSGASYTQTNDRGEFRMTGRPGRYYIQAAVNRELSFRRGQDEIRTDGTSPALYGTTYFPDATSKDRATPVEVKAGEETSGIEIRMTHQQNLTISGQVAGVPSSNTRAIVSILSKGDGGPGTNSSSVSTDAQGHFTFGSLKPGTYTIFAQWFGEKTHLQSQVQKISLGTTDVSGVVLSLGPAGEVSGTLEITPSDRRVTPLEKLTVSFSPVDFPVYNLQGDPAPVDKDGAFHLSPLAPAIYHLEVSPLPDDAYIKTILLDGVAVSKDWKDQVDFSTGVYGSAMKIIVGLNGGEISGVVHDKDGSAMTGEYVMVFLTNDPKDTKDQKVERIKPDGAYRFQGIRPGKYHIFAVNVMKNLTLETEEAPVEMAAKGEEIEIKEGDRLKHDLTALTNDEPVKGGANEKPLQ